MNWAAIISMRQSPAVKSARVKGRLSIMVGGDEAVFERVKPLFELLGKNITLVGGNGGRSNLQSGKSDYRGAQY